MLFDWLCCLPRWRTLERVFTRCGADGEDLFLVQIGANDGRIYDFLHPYLCRYRWRGLLVEPLGYYFERLQHTYRDYPQLTLEQAAISDRDGLREMYRIDERIDYLPRWCRGLGSFHREVLLSHRWALPRIEDYIVTETVRCLRLQSLIERHGVQRIDVLAIDTEGHDLAVLRQFDLARYRPRAVLFEHEYIPALDRRDTEARFRAQGYTLSRHLGNTLAYRVAP